MIVYLFIVMDFFSNRSRCFFFLVDWFRVKCVAVAALFSFFCLLVRRWKTLSEMLRCNVRFSVVLKSPSSLSCFVHQFNFQSQFIIRSALNFFFCSFSIQFSVLFVVFNKNTLDFVHFERLLCREQLFRDFVFFLFLLFLTSTSFVFNSISP